ncbi:hypothetical protein BH11ARM2_BH11ARM2_35540 [soil metagenome]
MNLFSKLTRRKALETPAPRFARFERQMLESPYGQGPLDAATTDEMERDSMVQTALTVKRLGVLAAPWHLNDDGSPEGKRRREFVQEAFARMEGSPDTLLGAAMDAFSRGWSVQELVYEEANGRIWLKAALPQDPSRFALELDPVGGLAALRLELPGEEPRRLDPAKFAIYRHRPGYGRPRGLSDLEAALPHWRAKGELSDAWAQHLRKFASPTVVGKFARTVTAAEQESLFSALRNLARNRVVVHPDDVEITRFGGDEGGGAGFLEAIEFHNREIARAILGQTLATDEGRRVGSLALGKVHLQVMLLQLEAIRRELADSVMTEQVIRPLIELNFGPGPIPRFEFERSQVEAFATGKI